MKALKVLLRALAMPVLGFAIVFLSQIILLAAIVRFAQTGRWAVNDIYDGIYVWEKRRAHEKDKTAW